MYPRLNRLLDGVPALRDLPQDALCRLDEASVQRTVVAGEYLFRQGDGPPDDVWYLVSGTAEILAGPVDDEHVVSLSRPGQFVGWLTVFSREPFPASARVVEPGEVLQIRAAVLRGLMERYPSVSGVLAATMASRLEDLFRQIRDQAGPLRHSPGDTFLFRKRVSEVMSSPVLTLPASASARAAAQAMHHAGTGSVVVTSGTLPEGIVTERDLVQRVVSEGREPERTLLRRIMTSPVDSVLPEDYLYHAVGVMRRRGVRHLPVVDHGRMVGILSMRALTALGNGGIIDLGEEIDRAHSIEDLRVAHRRSMGVCATFLAEGIAAEEVSRLLSHVNRDIHRRVLDLCLEQMKDAGYGHAPVAFCFIVMGSHGRGENHFNTDQDHGMILADYPPADWAQVEPFFMELSERVSLGLAEVGFSLCRGHVMSRNPVWRKPIREWKAQVEGWYANPTSRSVRYTTLFYDFVPVWGDVSLARDLRDYITRGIQRNQLLLRSLFEEASHHRVPLTLFKNFVTEKSGPHKGEMDLKHSGLLFVVECARILALRHGVGAVGTLDRLQALAEVGSIPRDEAEFICTAYQTLFHFLLSAQAARVTAGLPPDNYIVPQSLKIQERYLLRHALEATGRLQGLVHACFGDVLF